MDVYHDKKKGYRLMVSLFRGLDLYRRMCLSDEQFDRALYMKNFRKYITYFPDANLVNLVLEKNPSLKSDDIGNKIVDCLKIINKQVDKSRFQIYFWDKLNLRSGFTGEFMQRVEWFYFPQRRRKKRNLDELYSIKSITDSGQQNNQYTRSFISFLSARDIDICNKLFFTLHQLYYKKTDLRKFMVRLFHALDNFEYSQKELTDEQKENFKSDFQNRVLDNSSAGSLINTLIYLNPKINPKEIMGLLPTVIKIMKEKIDNGFERRKKSDPTLNNSFNPLDKYYQVYDRRLFRLYKKIR
jgi:hypothetical protein